MLGSIYRCKKQANELQHRLGLEWGERLAFAVRKAQEDASAENMRVHQEVLTAQRRQYEAETAALHAQSSSAYSAQAADAAKAQAAAVAAVVAREHAAVHKARAETAAANEQLEEQRLAAAAVLSQATEEVVRWKAQAAELAELLKESRNTPHVATVTKGSSDLPGVQQGGDAEQTVAAGPQSYGTVAAVNVHVATAGKQPSECLQHEATASEIAALREQFAEEQRLLEDETQKLLEDHH
jgi:hypothetical protein